MKIYKSQKEFEAEIKDHKFYSEESIDITAFNLNVDAHIEVKGNINARNINAWDIKAWDINARNINAWDINAWDIKAWDIKARNINAWDINAMDIKAMDIKATDINAMDIKATDINAMDIKAENVIYYAIAFAYKNIKVKSIKGRRENAKHFVLDGKLEIKDN